MMKLNAHIQVIIICSGCPCINGIRMNGNQNPVYVGSFSLSPAVKMGYVPTLGPICDDRGLGKISTFATVEGLRMFPESLKNT